MQFSSFHPVLLATTVGLATLAWSALPVMGWAQLGAQPIVKIDLSTQPVRQREVIPLSRPERPRVPLSMPEPGTPAAELQQLSIVLANVVNTEVSSETVAQQLHAWAIQAAPVPLQRQRAALLLQLGANEPAQALLHQLETAGALHPAEVLAVDSFQWQKTHVATWRETLRGQLAGKAQRTQQTHTAAQQTLVASLAASPSLEDLPQATVQTLPQAERRFMNQIWPAYTQGLAAVEQAYKAVNETLLKAPLSPMTRVHQREALMTFVDSQRTRVAAAGHRARSFPAPADVMRHSPVGEETVSYSDLKQAVSQWLEVQTRGLELLAQQISTPTWGQVPTVPSGQPAPVQSPQMLLTAFSQANAALLATAQPFTQETLRLPVSIALFEARQSPEIEVNLAAMAQLLPLQTTVWQGLTQTTDTEAESKTTSNLDRLDPMMTEQPSQKTPEN